MAVVTPIPIDDNVSPIVDAVQDLVETGFTTAQAYADTAFTNATAYLEDLSTLAESLTDVPDVDVDIGASTVTVTPYAAPTAPVEPSDLALVMPDDPEEPEDLTVVVPDDPVEPDDLAVTLPETLDAFELGEVATITLPATPEYDVVAPTLAMPDAVEVLDAEAPVVPDITPVEVPELDDYVLPDVPELTALTIPETPELSLPSFTATLAAAPDEPENTYEFTESTYTSTLTTAVSAALLSWVNGAATGLDATDEAALWNRSRAREATTLARKSAQLTREFASRGFTKPMGALSISVQEAAQQTQDVDLAASREIAINQATLKQANRHFAIEKSIAIESVLIGYTGQVAQRAFESAKFAQQIGLDIFNGMVQLFNAQAQAYGTEAQVFKVKVDAELAELEVMKAEIEAQKLIGQMNLQDVELYRAKVDGVKSTIDAGRLRLEAANVALQNNKQIIETAATEAVVYDSQVKAKALEYQGFDSLVRAQNLHLDLYGKKNEGFGRRLEATSTTITGLVGAKTAEIRSAQEMPLSAFRAAVELLQAETTGEIGRADTATKVLNARTQLVDAKVRAELGRVDAGTKVLESRTKVYDAKVRGEQARVEGGTKLLEARTQVYDSKVKGEAARVDSQVKHYSAEISYLQADANIRIEAAKAVVARMATLTGLVVECVKGGATVSAQLAASSLAGVNLSAGLSASGNASFGFNQGNSTSNNAQNSDSNSSSSSTSESTSTGTNYNYALTSDDL